MAALAPLAKKRALAQMRLSGVPIQTNLQRGAGAVPYSQRLCPRGCAAAVDTEQHVLFECQATAAARARYRDVLGACDMRCLMDKMHQQKDVWNLPQATSRFAAGDVEVVLGDDREAVAAYLQERAQQERRWEGVAAQTAPGRAGARCAAWAAGGVVPIRQPGGGARVAAGGGGLLFVWIGGRRCRSIKLPAAGE